MKNIAHEIGGNIKYEESKNRLIVTLSDIEPEQFKKLINKLERTVRETKAEDCIWDARNRKGTRHELEQFAVQRSRKAMELSLKRIAIIQPESLEDRKLSEQFISDMNTDAVQAFDTKQEAEQWLDQAGGEQKKAA